MELTILSVDGIDPTAEQLREYHIVRTDAGVVLKSRLTEPTAQAVQVPVEKLISTLHAGGKDEAAVEQFSSDAFALSTLGFESVYLVEDDGIVSSGFRFSTSQPAGGGLDEEVEEEITPESASDCNAAHDHVNDRFTVSVGTEGIIDVIDVENGNYLAISDIEQAQALINKLVWAMDALDALDEVTPF